jgi:hypothetical protein
LDSSIFELKRAIRRLEQEIKNLDSILAAEAATEAQKNSWGAWLLSPIYKKAEESEDEKARKDRGKQERRIEKDMKERRLESKKADLKKEEALLQKAKEEVDAADLSDDGKIRVIQARIRAKEIWERQEKERLERERRAKVAKQQQEQREEWEREAVEALRKQQAETRAEQKQYARFNVPKGSTHQAHTSSCRHDGWWPKVQGRTACPQCHEIWTYLLQCPNCEMKACPKCQSVIRPRRTRNEARTFQPGPSRVRTPSPELYHDYW